jgi:hypothetical protein
MRSAFMSAPRILRTRCGVPVKNNQPTIHTHHPTSTSSPRVLISSCAVNILSVNLALLGHAVHTRGNDSWEACDILCTDVKLYQCPTPVRLQYPIPQPLLRPHHTSHTESHAHHRSTCASAHNSTHSPLFSLLHVTFARMPAHQSSHVDPLVICGCVADSSDLSRLSATQTQVQCIARRSRDHDGHIPTGMRSGSSIRQRSERDRDVRPEPWRGWDFRPTLPTGFTTITTSTSATDSGKCRRQLPKTGLEP